MTRKLLAALMCIVMATALLSATAFADTEKAVLIAGQRLTSTNPYYHNGYRNGQGTVDNVETDYNAYFDAAQNTLYLDNLQFTPRGGNEVTVGIDFDGDLTIVVSGENRISTSANCSANANYGIYVTGDLTVNTGSGGGGVLTVVANGMTDVEGDLGCYGIFMSDSQTLTVNGVTLTAQVASDSDIASVVDNQVIACGVRAGEVIVNGGTLDAYGGYAKASDGGTTYSYGLLVSSGNLTVYNNGTVNGIARSNNTGDNVSNSIYGIWVRGTLSAEDSSTVAGRCVDDEGCKSRICCGIWAQGFYDGTTYTGGGAVTVSGSAVVEADTTGCTALKNFALKAQEVYVGSGELRAYAGRASNEGASSIGVMINPDGRDINVTGGILSASTTETTKGTRQALSLGNGNLHLNCGPGVAAKGSASSGGTNPEPYAEANNANYKWVQAQKLIPALMVTASPTGSVAMNTRVTLTATASNIEEPDYQWYSNVENSTEGAIPITDATATTYNPPTGTAGTVYYYCMVPDVAESNIVGVTVNQPAASGSGGNTPSPVTIYNASSQSNATVWLTGGGLDSSDLLVTSRNPSGSVYQALQKLADSDDVFATYNIYLRSGKKSTGSAMNLTFDLNAQYAGNDFTLVHRKADSTYEYFYDTADGGGDLSFGPLYELSPFMLVKGRLAATVISAPKTGDNAQPALWAGVALASAWLMGTALYKRKRT